jgi:N-acetylmuramoyl-L-alanine amidase
LPPPPRYVAVSDGGWVALDRWCASNRLAAPTLLSAGASAGFALKTPNGTFSARVGSTVARWEGLEIHIGFPPEMINDRPLLHSLDLRATVWPLATDDPPWEPENRVVVIDPGHGGADAGARSVEGARYEKEFTLDWGLRLASLLRTSGWTVRLTRERDVQISLADRVEIAERAGADLFLSLHFNSFEPSPEKSGLETYCLTPAGMGSTLTRGPEEDAAQAFPNNEFDGANLRLALQVHRALLRVNGHNDRGIRHARFPVVLRGQHRPAVLIEGGYLSNPREARMIADAAYRQRLAEAVAGALAPPSPRLPPGARQTAGGGATTSRNQLQ